MKKGVKILLIVIGVLAVIFLFYLVFGNTYPFSGYVYDSDTKEPVEGAKVKVLSCYEGGYGCRTVLAYTNSEGRFKRRTFYEHQNLVSVEKEGYHYYGPFFSYGNFSEIYIVKLNSTSNSTYPSGVFGIRNIS